MKKVFVLLVINFVALTLIPPVFATDSPDQTPTAQVSYSLGRILNEKEKEVKKVKVGDPISIKALGAKFSAPVIELADPKTSFEDLGWEILEKTQSEEGEETTFVAIPIQPGKLVLPPLVLKDADGKELGKTIPFEIEVESAISPSDPKPSEPEAAEPPVGLQFPTWVLWIVAVLSGVFLAALGYVIYRLWKDRRNSRVVYEKILEEDEIALAEFAKLEALDLLSKGEFKRHYFSISEILKIMWVKDMNSRPPNRPQTRCFWPSKIGHSCALLLAKIT
jgi:hypothetical protein